MSKIKSILFSVLGIVFALNSYGQFKGSAGVVTECDCNKKLNNLTVEFTIPESVGSYDLISFDVMLGGLRIGNKLFYAREWKAGQVVKYSILSPTSEGTREMMGQETGLFSGDYATIDYSRVCELFKGTQKMNIQIRGITQTGTNVTYTYNKGSNTVDANYKKIYDSGVNIGESASVNIVQLDLKK